MCSYCNYSKLPSYLILIQLLRVIKVDASISSGIQKGIDKGFGSISKFLRHSTKVRLLKRSVANGIVEKDVNQGDLWSPH